METNCLVLVIGLLSLVSSVECNQNYALLASKVQILEMQVRVLSSLLQSQSTILSTHISGGGHGSTPTSTSGVDSGKAIKELQKKVASLETLSKNQEAKIKLLNDKLVELKNADTNNRTDGGTVDLTVVNRKINALSTTSRAHDSRIKELEIAMTSTITDVRNLKEDGRISKMARDIGALQTTSKAHSSQLKNLGRGMFSANIRISQNQKDRQALESKVRAQASQIGQLQSQGVWASGKYCILASGSCPVGFTRVSAWMKALKVFRGTGGYMQQANFGSSNIRCHGPCNRDDQWVGELTIVACCK